MSLPLSETSPFLNTPSDILDQSLTQNKNFPTQIPQSTTLSAFPFDKGQSNINVRQNIIPTFPERSQVIPQIPFTSKELYQDQDQEVSPFLDKDLYITQFDVDIPWFTIIGGKLHSDNIPSTSFSISIEDAQEYGNKITKLALEKGALISSLDPRKTSYPIIGHIIFTVRFTSEPKINILNEISRQELINLLKNPFSGYDITSYIPNWVPHRRRYVLHPSSYSKLNLLHIKLIKTTAVNEHTGFCLFNTLSESGRLKLEHIQLIKELLSNGDGKSFTIQQPIGGSLQDPFYNKYLEFKSKYLLNKHKKNIPNRNH